VTIDAEASTGHPTPILETIGVVLAPVAIAISALDLALAIVAILQHIQAVASLTNTYGLTPARKGASVVILALLGLLGPPLLLSCSWTGRKRVSAHADDCPWSAG
jgi:hypothetical protein